MNTQITRLATRNRKDEQEAFRDNLNLKQVQSFIYCCDSSQSHFLTGRTFSGGGVVAAKPSLHWPIKRVPARRKVKLDTSAGLNQAGDYRSQISFSIRRHLTSCNNSELSSLVAFPTHFSPFVRHTAGLKIQKAFQRTYLALYIESLPRIHLRTTP